jgi:hypothetical protein
MRIGTIKTIIKEELSKFGELPAWLNPFLQTLNQFIGSVGLALKGNLTFEDNFSCVKKQMTFSHGIEQEINPNSKLRVTGVLVLNTQGVVVDKFGWSQKDNGSIGVTFYFNSGTEAICTVLILLG